MTSKRFSEIQKFSQENVYIFWWSANRDKICEMVRESEKVENRCSRWIPDFELALVSTDLWPRGVYSWSARGTEISIQVAVLAEVWTTDLSLCVRPPRTPGHKLIGLHKGSRNEGSIKSSMKPPPITFPSFIRCKSTLHASIVMRIKIETSGEQLVL